MRTVFHAWLFGRFMKIQSNLKRKKLHRTNQGSDFLEDNFSNRDNVRAPIQFWRKRLSSILKDDFSSWTGPSIFTSLAPVLLNNSNESSWLFFGIEINKLLPAPVQCLVDHSGLLPQIICLIKLRVNLLQAPMAIHLACFQDILPKSSKICLTPFSFYFHADWISFIGFCWGPKFSVNMLPIVTLYFDDWFPFFKANTFKNCQKLHIKRELMKILCPFIFNIKC